MKEVTAFNGLTVEEALEALDIQSYGSKGDCIPRIDWYANACMARRQRPNMMPLIRAGMATWGALLLAISDGRHAGKIVQTAFSTAHVLPVRNAGRQSWRCLMS